MNKGYYWKQTGTNSADTYHMLHPTSTYPLTAGGNVRTVRLTQGQQYKLTWFYHQGLDKAENSPVQDASACVKFNYAPKGTGTTIPPAGTFTLIPGTVVGSATATNTAAGKCTAAPNNVANTDYSTIADSCTASGWGPVNHANARAQAFSFNFIPPCTGATECITQEYMISMTVGGTACQPGADTRAYGTIGKMLVIDVADPVV